MFELGAVADVVIVLLLVSALVAGVRRGLLSSLGLWAGLVAGAIAAYWAVPIVIAAVPSAVWRGPAAVLAAIVLLGVGSSLGEGIGRLLGGVADKVGLRWFERLLGGAAGVVVGALAASLLTATVVPLGVPVVSSALGASSVVRTIDGLTPAPVAGALARVRTAILDGQLPELGELFGGLDGQDVPEVDAGSAALRASGESVARITGIAYSCGRSVSGTGFIVAEDRIVTNAHVVAGVDDPVVELPGEAALPGRVVYFDPVDDLAVIAVDGLQGEPLPIAGDLAVGEQAVVQGYPYGGPFSTVGAEVVAVGDVPVPDIYGGASEPRGVSALATDVYPGNSGGPLLSTDGEVVGVIFARGADGQQIGYATTVEEASDVLTGAAGWTSPVATGACAA
ncbi:MarP family serine protease [Arenivirga flava]|uniref:Serine protease n=1 Tax=Arenivirga flava TaxID=1930060 RepID=A0AA37UMM5_9MICO|nr:MarP family serine protease [Arenivirga flava]GMA27606.1 serine protease [Arenivirga flava]